MDDDSYSRKPNPNLELRLREIKKITIIDIEGQLDLNASELIELVGWLMKRGKRKILLNFEGVQLLDYNGLSVIAIVYKNVKNYEGILKFQKVPLHIEKLFRVAQLLDIFELYQEEKLALLSFEEKAIRQPVLPPLRRRFRRFEGTNIVVEYAPMHRKDDPPQKGKAMDLGGEGLFLYCEKNVPLNTELLLKLHLEKNTPPFEVTGVVVWHADKEIQPQMYPGLGIQFRKLSSDQQKFLIDFIDRNITQRSG